MRYRAQLGGQPEPDVLLVRLRDAPGRPVVRLHLPEPITDLKWPMEQIGTVVSDDPISDDMSGSVELP